MARKPRLHYPGAMYHVILRGNDKQDVFFDPNDRRSFYALLADGVERFGHRIHAFCLMTNHVHLAVQVAQVPLSKIVQNLAFRYARWINGRYHRVGHLFQGRYNAKLVDADCYLLQLVRYIHMNPVSANLVADPASYPWSSHRAYLGNDHLAWLTTDAVLGHFGRSRSVALKRYAQHVVGDSQDHGNATLPVCNDPRVLGDDEFVERVSRRVQTRQENHVNLDDIVRTVCARYRLDLGSLRRLSKQRVAAEARAVIAYLALELGAATGKEVADEVGRASESIYDALARLRIRLGSDEELLRRVTELRDQIPQIRGLTPA